MIGIRLLFIFLFFPLLVYSQNPEHFGLKTTSRDAYFKYRSVIFLNEGKPLEFENRLSVSFDIAFWTNRYYGSIISVVQDENILARLIFNQFSDPENFLISLNVKGDNNPISYVIPKKSFRYNHWYRIRIDCNTVTREVTLYCNKSRIGSTHIQNGLNWSAPVAFFGVTSKYPVDYDIPGMYLRDIRIESNGTLQHHWELNPWDHDRLEDKISGAYIEMQYTKWRVEDFYRFRTLAEFELSGLGYSTSLDPNTGNVFIDFRDHLIRYSLRTRKAEKITYQNSRTYPRHAIKYNPKQNRLESFYCARGEVAILNETTGQWSKIDTSGERDLYHYWNSLFTNPLDGGVMMFGGYGWYTVKSDLGYYDYTSGKWNNLKYKGSIKPRGGAMVFEGFHYGQVFIFGGSGNESGKQQDVYQEFNDLHLLDLRDTTIRLVWNDSKSKVFTEDYYMFKLLPESGWLDKKDSLFFYVYMLTKDGQSIGKLFRNSTSFPNEVQVAESFLIGDDEKTTIAHLTYVPKNNELIIIGVMGDGKTVSVSSMLYPPVNSDSIPDLVNENASSDNLNAIWFFLGGLIVIAVAAGALYFRKKSRTKSVGTIDKSSQTAESVAHPNGVSMEDEQLSDSLKDGKKNAVEVMGGFRLYNADGDDISNQFTPRIKELFLLIWCRTFLTRTHGITSEELSDILWESASPESAKTNRGVNINKLRKLLAPVNGIEVVFEDKLWRITVSREAVCDFVRYKKLKNAVKRSENVKLKHFEYLADVLTPAGGLLPGADYPWLDPLKEAVNSEIRGFLKDTVCSDLLGDNFSLRMRLCDCSLRIEPLQEDIVRIKLKILTKTGDHSVALNTFKQFCNEYQEMFSTPFAKEFHNFLESEP